MEPWTSVHRGAGRERSQRVTRAEEERTATWGAREWGGRESNRERRSVTRRAEMRQTRGRNTYRFLTESERLERKSISKGNKLQSWVGQV